MSVYGVCVEVATLWSSPDAPRAVDAPAVADEPDLAAWMLAMDVDARLDLHGRTETQLLRGEPVLVVEEAADGWVRVAAPWQPSPKDVRGYPGWVRRSHLTRDSESGPQSAPQAALEADALKIADYARGFLGLRYLWGGLSRYGIDCSGLVHLSYRQAGLVIPRDADAQHAAATPVLLGEELPGDLYFFAREDGYVFHVGFVTGPMHMLHAPEARKLIEDAPLGDDRRESLLGAGRFVAAKE